MVGEWATVMANRTAIGRHEAARAALRQDVALVCLTTRSWRSDRFAGCGCRSSSDWGHLFEDRDVIAIQSYS